MIRIDDHVFDRIHVIILWGNRLDNIEKCHGLKDNVNDNIKALYAITQGPLCGTKLMKHLDKLYKNKETLLDSMDFIIENIHNIRKNKKIFF